MGSTPLQHVAEQCLTSSPGHDGTQRQTLQHALGGPPFYALVTGASGMGKTCLLRDIAAGLDRHRHHIVYVSSSKASLVGVVHFLAQDLHVSPRRCYLETVQILTEAIQAQTAHLLLWIDEAHEVDPATLQEVRMVAEAGLGAEQILSVVLSGLPSLLAHLDAPKLFPLKRRIALRCRLDGLRRDELDLFLEHRFGHTNAGRVPDTLRDELFERTQAAPALLCTDVTVPVLAPRGTLAIEREGAVLDAEYCRSQVGVGPGCYCVIQVSDSGAGMTEAELGKVFDPFYTTKAVGKGTGLGLSTTLGILRGHGGHITVESEPGRGTRVRMFVPETASSTTVEAKRDDDEAPGGDETILVVDDEVDLLEGVARLLGLKGYTVISASGGDEAVEIYRERHGEIDLVILDLVMPGPDGIEVYRAMRKIDPSLRAVLTSGFSPKERARELRGEGIQGFVAKPYSTGALCRTVREVLDSRA